MNYYEPGLVQADIPHNVDIILSQLENNKSYAFVSDLLDVSREEIKDIVYMYLPHFNNEQVLKNNHEEIAELFVNEVPICVIANRYGVQQSRLCRYVVDQLPDYAVERIESIKIDSIDGSVWMFSGMTWYKVKD